MRRTLAIVLVFAVGCSSAAAPVKKRTLPEPIVAADLPPAPKDEFVIAPEVDWAVAADGYIVIGDDEKSKTFARPGICMSMEKAARAARYVIRYDELRQLYLIDLRTWGRERQIYERHLELGQEEIDALRKAAERGWFERNSGPIGLAAGLILGIAAAAVAAGAINEAAD